MSRSRFDITAIIYDKRGRVLSIGKNSYCKTHPLQHHHACKVGLPHKQFLHAEIHAISRCKHLHKAHRISVCGLTPKANLAMQSLVLCVLVLLVQQALKL